jgi:5-methylthioadenosine/S-adenosylhomocysteine deaminase
LIQPHARHYDALMAGEPPRAAEALFTADLVLVDGQAKRDWAILVERGVVKASGPRKELDRPDVRIVGFAGRALLPGCVNAHAHSFQSLLRGFGDDLPFERWRASLFKYGPTLGPDAVYVGALFAFAEMLLHGTTTVCDFFYLQGGGNDNARAVVRAARDLGIRLVLARSFYDGKQAPKEFRETVHQATDRFHELRKEVGEDARVSVIPAPHSLHAASEEMIRAGAACAQQAGTPFHIHVAVTEQQVKDTQAQLGATPLRALDRMGVLSDRTVAVHGCWLDREERALMAERGAKLVQCPGSNMFLGGGITNVVDLRHRGVVTALGTDGGASNSRLSMFDEMRSSAHLQKLKRQDGGAITAEDVFAMGTVAGGVVLGQPVGGIAPGQHADFTLLDLDDLSLWPIQSLPKNVVYAMSHRAIQDVVVEGEVVVKDRQLVKMPLSAIRDRVRDLTKDWTRA